MRQILGRRIRSCLILALLLTGCRATKTGDFLSVREYLDVLALESGIVASQEEDSFIQLLAWNVVKESDASLLDRELDCAFLSGSICRLLGKNGDPLSVMKKENYLPQKCRGRDPVVRKQAEKIVVRALKSLNSRSFDPLYEAVYAQEKKSEEEAIEQGGLFESDGRWKIAERLEEDRYEIHDASFEEVFKELHLAGSSPVDFSKALLIPYADTYENSSYVNEKYKLLSESNNHVFYKNGFRISYTLNPSGIDFHISKNKSGLNIYLDVSLRNVKPEISWHKNRNDLSNCFFVLKFNTTEKFGVSSGRYRNYRMKFKDLDAASFKSLLSSLVEPLSESEEAEFPVCTIRVPLEHLPGVFLCLDLKIRLHASGKGEFVLYNSHQLGFETREGKIRFINENSHELNGILQASAKAVLGVNLGIEAAGFSLADVEVDGGIRGVIRTTAHFYDEKGNMQSEQTKVPYDGMSEISDGNPDILVCGDLSLHRLLDVEINTQRTQMGRYGLSRSFSLMDEQDQLFGGLRHIENGQFVEKCTRNKRDYIETMETPASERIVLDSYAEVLRKGQTYHIVIKALPIDCREDELIYESSDPSVASVVKGEITAKSSGSARISVQTKNGKHQAYVNILVSTQ